MAEAPRSIREKKTLAPLVSEQGRLGWSSRGHLHNPDEIGELALNLLKVVAGDPGVDLGARAMCSGS